MNTVKTWLAAHSITAKTVSAAWIFVTGMYYAQPAFHDFVTGAYAALPKGIHAVIAGILIPALIFWKSQKPAQP